PPPNRQSRNRRSDQTRSMEYRSIQCNRRRDLLPLYEFWNKRGKRWHLERNRDPEHRRKDNDVPDLDAILHNQHIIIFSAVLGIKIAFEMPSLSALVPELVK